MRRALLLLLSLFVALPACDAADEGAATEGTPAQAVLPGKADDYLSPTSREYLLWGLGELTLDETWADADLGAKEQRVQELLGYQLKAYSHFLNAFVTDKTSSEATHGYGGFSGLVRGTTADWVYEPIDEAGLLWTFIWEIEMGGPRDLLDRLPMQVRGDGSQYFVLPLPKLTESQLVAGSYPRDFDPAKYTGAMDDLEVLIDPVGESIDAWPAYDRLFEDGTLDVMIVVGGDYNAERYDLRSAESHFEWLKSAGFKHSAKVWTDLTLESGPFTRTLKAGGRSVDVAITLVHPDIVPDAQLDQLRAAIVAAYQQMDVVIYDGHAGLDPDYSGVVYHYNPRRALSANELAELELPDKYQVYVFNGCKTYSAYPEAVYQNATKSTANLDVISTVSFSWLSQQTFTTSGLLSELLATRSGTHDPRTWLEILSQINRANNWNVYYGVHGLDDNAHLNPYTDTASLCQACARDADCPGEGNRCVGFSWGRVCGAECTADDGCPDGYVCAEIAEGHQITGRQCLPATYTCD